MKECRKCSEVKNSSEFTKRKASSDGLHSYCKSCMAQTMRNDYEQNPDKFKNRNASKRQSLYEVVNGVKSQKGCHFCKENDPCCLDFHHIDATNKVAAIAKLITTKSKQKVLAEMEKCVIVCANCHRKIHAKKLYCSLT